MIITIDGPIATGKSTIAKRLAEKLGFIHFDTGAMYRCLTYAVIKHQIHLEDHDQFLQFLENFSFDVKLIDGEKHYFANGEDVTVPIRGQAVTRLVSRVAAFPQVRTRLVQLQRLWAQGVKAVFEGRDLGTVVFPKADLKIFLTGELTIRAQRRLAEMQIKFPEETESLSLEKMIADVKRRDQEDSTRPVSPLRCAEDAHVIDTSCLSTDQVIDKILSFL